MKQNDIHINSQGGIDNDESEPVVITSFECDVPVAIHQMTVLASIIYQGRLLSTVHFKPHYIAHNLPLNKLRKEEQEWQHDETAQGRYETFGQ